MRSLCRAQAAEEVGVHLPTSAVGAVLPWAQYAPLWAQYAPRGRSEHPMGAVTTLALKAAVANGEPRAVPCSTGLRIHIPFSAHSHGASARCGEKAETQVPREEPTSHS